MPEVINLLTREKLSQNKNQQAESTATARASGILNQVITSVIRQPDCIRAIEPFSRTQYLTPTDREAEYWSTFELGCNPDIKPGNLGDEKIWDLAIKNKTRAKVLDGLDFQQVGWTECATDKTQYLWTQSPSFPEVFWVRGISKDKYSIKLTEQLIITPNPSQLEQYLRDSRQQLAA